MNNKMNAAIGSAKSFVSNVSMKKNGIGNSAQVNGKRPFDANFRHPGNAIPPPFKQPYIPFNSLPASRASTSAAPTTMKINRSDASRTSQKPLVKANGVSSHKLKGVKSEEKWLLTNQQFYQIPSFSDGVKPKEEMKMRRRAAKFIQCMGEHLNRRVTESRWKVTQNCMGVAVVHFHRFFTVHSMKKFDARDVAAACLFLSSKSEECVRKLEHIVKVWSYLKKRGSKIPDAINGNANLDTLAYDRACKYIVFLEGVLLQTIGFDLQVKLPHPLVILKMQQKPECGNSVMRTAYNYATDILFNTDWCIRYSPKQLADVCEFLACNQKADPKQMGILKVLACLKGEQHSQDIPSSVLQCVLETDCLEDGEIE